MFINSPLEQFEVNLFYPFVLFNKIDLSITSVTVYGLAVLIVFFALYSMSFYKATIIPSRWQYVIESLYSFVLEILKQQTGTRGQLYFPLIFVVFVFILFSNFLGMTPYSYTLTSHIIVTLTIGFSIFLGITLIGVLRLKMHFLDLFLPQGVPSFLVPFIVMIEVISYLIKPFSLSVRLFANLMSGHTLLSILSQFTYALFKNKFWMGVVPFTIILAVTCLELGIAFLQAYVFVVLLSIYFSDSFGGGH